MSASYIALFFTAPQNVRRAARPSRDVFLLRRENLSALVLRVLIKLSVRSLIFPPQIVYLAVHGKLLPSSTFNVEHKTKSSHKRVSLLFWKPASTRRDLRFSSPTPRLRCWLAWRAVTPFRCWKMQAVQALRVFNKLSAPSLIFPRGCAFSHIFCKRKNSHKRASFFFWKPASTYSPGHVSASYIALNRYTYRNVRRVARPSRDVFLLRRENLSAPILRVLIKLSVRSLIFPPQIVYLAVHGKSFPSCTKQKHPTDVECFCFGYRRRHTLPGRVQPSTICADELNFCVRYENRWDLIAIDTGNC